LAGEQVLTNEGIEGHPPDDLQTQENIKREDREHTPQQAGPAATPVEKRSPGMIHFNVFTRYSLMRPAVLFIRGKGLPVDHEAGEPYRHDAAKPSKRSTNVREDAN